MSRQHQLRKVSTSRTNNGVSKCGHPLEERRISMHSTTRTNERKERVLGGDVTEKAQGGAAPKRKQQSTCPSND